MNKAGCADRLLVALLCVGSIAKAATFTAEHYGPEAAYSVENAHIYGVYPYSNNTSRYWVATLPNVEGRVVYKFDMPLKAEIASLSAKMNTVCAGAGDYGALDVLPNGVDWTPISGGSYYGQLHQLNRSGLVGSLRSCEVIHFIREVFRVPNLLGLRWNLWT